MVQPDDTLFIRDLETLRVMVDPLRGMILELLVQTPQTIKEAAEKLGATPNKLYYHFGLLEKHGLIRVAETRQVAHLLEKVYCASARAIQVDPALVSITTPEGRTGMREALLPLLDQTREDLLRSFQIRSAKFAAPTGAAEPETAPALRRLLVSREISHLPPGREEEFLARLQALVEEFVAANQGRPDAASPSYALTVAFYPSFYYEK